MSSGQSTRHDRFTHYGWNKYSVFLFALLLVGCGSGSIKTPPVSAGGALAITAQPSNAYVALGSTGSFSVTATGGSTLQYQWSENGMIIAGATSATYTTPAVEADESGASFQVNVSDGSDSVASSTAMLTVGPRAPKPGDLRFLLYEQVSAPGLGDDGGIVFGLDSGLNVSFDNSVGVPLRHGDACGSTSYLSCGWTVDVSSLPPGTTNLSMYYESDSYSAFDSDLTSLLTSNSVLTSIDFQIPAQEFAISQVSTSASVPFDGRLEIVDPSQLQTTATEDGDASRIITAVAYDASGDVNLLSYGWQGDTSTVYDTQAVIAAPGGVIAAATQLASEGYAISAFGGNNTAGYILVGVRVQGDTMPRPIEVDTVTSSVAATNPGSGYFTEVAAFVPNSGGYTLISEQ